MRVLGIDYGQRRIGLALSDATGLLARPWKTMAREGNPQQVAAGIAREVAVLRSEADGLVAVVVGWPRRLSGEANQQTAAVDAFVAHLRTAIDVPVVLEDERLSSWEADRLLAEKEPDWRKRKPLLDAMAAAVILQNYLDGQPRTTATEDLDT
jgi:putative Holliday junction resolvase